MLFYLIIAQDGRDAARVRAVPDARAEARVVAEQRAGRAARRARAALPAPRLRLAAHALQCKGDLPPRPHTPPLTPSPLHAHIELLQTWTLTLKYKIVFKTCSVFYTQKAIFETYYSWFKYIYF